MENRSFKISGKVQGVYFRASLKQYADERGIRGYVRNEQDGSVWVEAEASSEDLSQLEGWCKHGPALARVQDVISEQGNVQNYPSFEIK